MAVLRSNEIESAPAGFAFVRGDDLVRWADGVLKLVGADSVLGRYVLQCVSLDRITYLDDPAKERPLKVKL